jgi:hypothetical protein
MGGELGKLGPQVHAEEHRWDLPGSPCAALQAPQVPPHGTRKRSSHLFSSRVLIVHIIVVRKRTIVRRGNPEQVLDDRLENGRRYSQMRREFALSQCDLLEKFAYGNNQPLILNLAQVLQRPINNRRRSIGERRIASIRHRFRLVNRQRKLQDIQCRSHILFRFENMRNRRQKPQQQLETVDSQSYR